MTAKSESILEVVTIEANDKSQDVDIRNGVMSIDYFEDIFSPTVTAKMLYIILVILLKGRMERYNLFIMDCH
jgi:hypothetical protein